MIDLGQGCLYYMHYIRVSFSLYSEANVRGLRLVYAWFMLAVGIDLFDQALPPFDARQSGLH